MALLEGVKHGKFPLYTVSGFVLEMFFEIYIPWLQDGILRNRDQRKLRSEKVDQDGSATKGKGNKRKKTDRKDKSKKHTSNKSKNDGSKKKPQQNTTKPAKKKADPKAENGVSEPRGKKKASTCFHGRSEGLERDTRFQKYLCFIFKSFGKILI